MIFPDFKEKTKALELIVDIVWTLDIFSKFLRPLPTAKKPTLKSVAKSYVFEGSFILDIVATVPPMVTAEAYTSINFLKYLRLWHFGDIMRPIKLLIGLFMYKSHSKNIKNCYDFLVLILSVMLLAHFIACTWIFLGRRDLELEEEDRSSWLLHPESDFLDYNNTQIYVFTYYWIFEVITTVGYGDYSGVTSSERSFSILIEFVGLSFFSLLMGLMSTFFTNLDQGFEALLAEHMFKCDLWIRRIERTRKGFYLPPKMYELITTYIEDAFKFDFNLIIEQQNPFFDQMSPKMQAETINSLS